MTTMKIYREKWTNNGRTISAWLDGLVEPKISVTAEQEGDDGFLICTDDPSDMVHTLYERMSAYGDYIPDWWESVAGSMEIANKLVPIVRLEAELWNIDTGLPVVRASGVNAYTEPHEAILEWTREPLGPPRRRWRGTSLRTKTNTTSESEMIGALIGQCIADMVRRTPS